jgi:hypothetical protein
VLVVHQVFEEDAAVRSDLSVRDDAFLKHLTSDRIAGLFSRRRSAAKWRREKRCSQRTRSAG